MKSSGVTIIRGSGKKVPDDYLSKALAANNTGISVSVANNANDAVISFRSIKTFGVSDVQKLMGQDKIKDKKAFLFLSSSLNNTKDEDIQPYPVLVNDTGKPMIVAFLNGDFSQFTKEGQPLSPEVLCLQSKIIPFVQKAYKASGNDIAKTMLELQDELYTDAFANLMVGPNGSITLLPCSGEAATFEVATDILNAEADDNSWWTSNAYDQQEPEAAPVKKVDDDDLSDLMPDKTPAAEPVAVAQAQPKPGHGLPGSKPGKIVAASAAQFAVQPAPDAASVVAASIEDLKDSEKELTLKIPPGMPVKRIHKWLTQRMPEQFLPKSYAGLKTITLKRRDANLQFLQTYVEQNKLGSLGDVMHTVIPKSSGGKVVPAAGQTEFPVTDKPAEPAKVPASEPQKQGDVKPAQVTSEVLPIFSPRQISETITFRDIVDKKGNKIESPATMEKKIGTFAKFFGNNFKIADLERWHVEDMQEYAKKDYGAAGNLLYWAIHELREANRMLDEVTAPHLKPKTEETVVEQPVATPAVQRSGRIVRKVA